MSVHVRYSFFALSVALFVSGVGFVIAGARAGRHAAPAAVVSAVQPTAIATVKQIMKGITGPAALTVFNAVGTVISEKGIEERAPKTDEEWEIVGNAAAALIESGNLMLVGNRAVDADWVQRSRGLIEAGKVALAAAQAKNAAGVFESGERINNTCDGCHMKYQRGS